MTVMATQKNQIYEAATYAASQIARAYENPLLADVTVGTGQPGRDLARLVIKFADERSIKFGDALKQVLADERVASQGRNDDVRREAIKGFLVLAES